MTVPQSCKLDQPLIENRIWFATFADDTVEIYNSKNDKNSFELEQNPRES